MPALRRFGIVSSIAMVAYLVIPAPAVAQSGAEGADPAVALSTAGRGY